MSVSLVVNYYNNEKSLKFLLENFKKISEVRKDFFELVLVDDASPTPMDLAHFNGIPNLRVFRLRENVAWNMPGARNIGALEARNKQILFCDVDHLLEPEELECFLADSEKLALNTRMTPNRIRAFGRVFEGETLKPNINCFLIHRQDFFIAGGYEELFAGHYSQEDKYFRYCCRWNAIEDVTASFKLSVITGGSTKDMERDKTRNEGILDALVKTHNFKARNAFRCAYDQIF